MAIEDIAEVLSPVNSQMFNIIRREATIFTYETPQLVVGIFVPENHVLLGETAATLLAMEWSLVQTEI